MYNSYNCHSYKKNWAKLPWGSLYWTGVLVCAKKWMVLIKNQMRRVLFGLLGLSPQNCNLGLKTAICVAILKGFQKRYQFENKTSTSQDNNLNFSF